MTRRISDLELDRVRASRRLSDVVGAHVTWDRRRSNPSRQDFWACCPFHGESSPSFHVDDSKGRYKCFGCGAAGDHFRFLQEFSGMSFIDAYKALGGQLDMPEPSPEERAEAERQRAMRQAEADAQAESFRRKEVAAARRILDMGGRVAGTAGADYLRGRGLLPCPIRLPLRFVQHLQYWHAEKLDGQDTPRRFVLFSGPALVLPISGPSGAVQGVHMTWLDTLRHGKKKPITCPQTGEALTARKMRGSKRGAYLDLITPAQFDRVVIGEGWETTLTVALAELRHKPELFARTSYRAAISLQHLGGKAAETVAHPELKNKAGRAVRVPGPVPDMSDSTALELPDHVTDVLLLGDSDSDRFTAMQVHTRARARWSRPGRRLASAWAPEGQDFNDMLMMSEEAQ